MAQKRSRDCVVARSTKNNLGGGDHGIQNQNK